MHIGLTGGIATGKSTVSQMLVAMGARLIDADQVSREVVLPGEPALAEIADVFGQAVIQDDGSLDRKALGSIVFSDHKQRKRLENILHPRIRQVMLSRLTDWERESPDRLVVVDIPLLFESGLQKYFTEVMVVYVKPAIQLERLMSREKMSIEEAKQRINTQWPIEKKKQLADVVIDNSGSIAETRSQVESFWQSKMERNMEKER